MSAEPARFTIGSRPDCDVVLTDDAVAPQHCEVCFDGTDWQVIPRDGEVAMDQNGDRVFSRDPMDVSPKSSVWITPDTRLPWPCSHGSRRTFTVGRATDCDLEINHASVSGLHARLVVGFQNTLVLLDCESRNGLFLDESLTRRVRGVGLPARAGVFFGSCPVQDELLRFAQQQQQAPTRKTSVAVATRGRANRSIHWLGHIAIVACSIAVLVVGARWMRDPEESARRTDPPATEPGSGFKLTETERVEAPMESAAAETLILPESVQSAETNPAESQSLPDDDKRFLAPARTATYDEPISRSTYWVIVTEPELEKSFRLGTALAVSPQRLVTTASIIQSIDELLASGFADPAIVCVDGGDGGETIPISSRRTWPPYDAALKRWRELKPQEPNSDSVQLAARQMLESRDLGWISVEHPLSNRVNLLPSAEFHPGQPFTLGAGGFDAADPLWQDSSVSAGQAGQETAPSLCRVQFSIPPSDRSAESSLVTLSAPTRDGFTANFVGCPILRGDTVAGIIVSSQVTPGSVRITALAVDAQRWNPPEKD